jgi:hypothetical protein
VVNPEHFEILKKGVAEWNEWRRANPTIFPNLINAYLHGTNLRDADLRLATLSGTNLRGADLRLAILSGATLNGANLDGANLDGADLNNAVLSGASLNGADLSRAILSRADLSHADLNYADLSYAILSQANLSRADLIDANMTGVYLGETIFASVDLTRVIGLETCVHLGPSSIDYRTLERSKSKQLPLAFLRGVGLPNNLIEYLPSLLNQAIQLYSCFISYSVKDDEFVSRIHADLQNNGVLCWKASHDLPIGEKILEGIDEAIGKKDKVLLVLSN